MNILYSTPSGQSTLATAKSRLNIHGVWQHFGLPGTPEKSCHSPFRDDVKPSFSVNDDGTLWHDFATGEGGDAVDFFQRASGLSKTEACRKFIALANGHITPDLRAPRSCLQPPEARPAPTFPDFYKGTEADIQQLSDLRQISCEGLQWASDRGLLWFTKLKNCAAWVVTDSARLNAQARRMDGQEWEHIGAKAWTLPGSWAAWPIGINEAKDFPAIALCEGGPDFLAAHSLAIHEQCQCAPVAILGSTQRIHAAALPLFATKRVRIFGHADDPGRLAVERWARQLASVNADVDAFSFDGLMRADGQLVNDLNDSFLMDGASFDAMGGMLP